MTTENEKQNFTDQRQRFKLEGPFNILQQLPEARSRQILEDVKIQLIRLEDRTPCQHTLSPSDKLAAAIMAETGLHDEEVARQYGTTRTVIRGTRKDVRAALVFVSPEIAATGLLLTEKERKKISQMQELEHELSVIRGIIENPAIVKKLKKVPHLRTVLISYGKYGTISPLFTEWGIGFDKRELNKYNRYVRKFFFGDIDDFEGVRRITQRLVLAKWLKTGLAWNEEFSVDSLVSRFAVAALEGVVPNSVFVRNLRHFLYFTLRDEFERAKTDKIFYDSDDFLAVFPTTTGERAINFSQVDVLKSYKAYETAGCCPESIKNFARQVVNGNTLEEESIGLTNGHKYSLATKRYIVWAGIAFLENIITSTNHQYDNSKIRYILTKKPGRVIRDIRTRIRSSSQVRDFRNN